MGIPEGQGKGLTIGSKSFCKENEKGIHVCWLVLSLSRTHISLYVISQLTYIAGLSEGGPMLGAKRCQWPRMPKLKNVELAYVWGTALKLVWRHGQWELEAVKPKGGIPDGRAVMGKGGVLAIRSSPLHPEYIL